MIEHEVLEWDSKHFGFVVVRILSDKSNQTLEDVTGKLIALRDSGVRLAYWSIRNDCTGLRELAGRLGGSHVDEKVTYELCLSSPSDLALCSDEILVTKYDGTRATQELIDLAIQSGVHSRFNVDSRIPGKRFEELYSVWIKKSVAGELADAVLVIKGDDERVNGMITVGSKDGTGKIGLVAVDEACRGKGYGKYLLAAAERYFVSKGNVKCEVVTQAKNLPACRLYESAGYNVCQVEHVHHFWLRELDFGNVMATAE